MKQRSETSLSKLDLIEQYRSVGLRASVASAPELSKPPQLFENRLAYSISEVASGLGVSARTVERAVQSGQLPSKKLGRRRLILGTDLGVWLNRKEQLCEK